MKFKRGQLVMSAKNKDTDSICIVIEEHHINLFGQAYWVWSLKTHQKFGIYERHLSPINPQEAESEV